MTARTWCPPRSSRAIACRPTNPFPPVTATRMRSPTFLLRGRSSSTAPARVKAAACAQDRQHDPAGHRVDEPQNLGLLQPVDKERIQAQERSEKSEAAEEQQISPVDTALRRAAADAAPVSDQHDKDQHHYQTVVGRHRVNVVRLAERGRIGVADTPRKPCARDRVVLAIDEVADATDRLAEGDADHRDVEHETDREPQPPRREVARDGRADRCAGRADPAVPEREQRERTRRIDGPVVEGMRDASTEEAADDHGDGERIYPIVMDEIASRAKRDEAPDDHSHEREDRMPGEAERSDVEVRIEWKVDQTAKVRACARGRVRRRKSIVTAAASTRTAIV